MISPYKPGDKMMWGQQIVVLTKGWQNIVTGDYSWDTNVALNVPESELTPLIKAKE